MFKCVKCVQHWNKNFILSGRRHMPRFLENREGCVMNRKDGDQYECDNLMEMSQSQTGRHVRWVKGEINRTK